jgi:hypothetical protein
MSREPLPKALCRLAARSAWALVTVAVCIATEARGSDQTPTFRIRFEWRGDAAAVWRGGLKIDQGRFDRPLSLGVARDDAGSIQVVPEGVVIRRRSARQSDAFEISVTAGPDARLEFELADALADGPPRHVDFSLSDCLVNTHHVPSDGKHPQIAIRRAPGDALTVGFERPHLVFEPQEMFRLTASFNLFEGRAAADESRKATLKWKLRPAQGGRSVCEGAIAVPAVTNGGRSASVPIEVRMPRDEGAYNLSLALSGHGFDDVDRTVQVVVVDPTLARPATGARHVENLVDSFDAQSPGLFRKVSLGSLQREHDHSFLRLLGSRRSRGDDRTFVKHADVNQVAYKLHVANPGRPHRLEVTLPAGSEGACEIAVFQAGASGRLERAAPDGLFLIGNPQSRSVFQPREDTAPQVYRQIFWPQHHEVSFTVSCGRSSQSQEQGPGEADWQPIEPVRALLYELDGSLAAHRPVVEPPAGRGSSPHKRLVGAYLHKPALVDNFGAPLDFDATEQLELEDWGTFLEAGRRMVDFVRCQQQSALMLAVFADGAALYPSRWIESSLRYDNGRLAASGQDPMQKDVLELVLRLCDRAGLALVPELQFDTPLPAIERLLREGDAVDLQLLDGEGRPLAEAQRDSAGSTPGYNILSPRVQEAALDVARELIERYKTHPSLAAVAFELGPQSFLQLPSLEWGYDRETVHRFEQATQIRVPGNDDDGWRREAYRFLTTTARREWVRYRCAEVARFHRRLSDVVAERIPAGRVIFSGSLPHVGESASEASVLDVVRAGSNTAQALQNQGLNFTQRLYANDRKLTILRPVIQAACADQLGSAALATLNDSPVIDSLYGGYHRGGLLRSFMLGPHRAAGRAWNGAGRPSPQVVAGPEAAARRYAHLLATTDAQIIFDGGDALAFTPDDAIGRIRQTIARLPDVTFHLAGPKVQPLVVRAANVGHCTYLYAVNDSSIPLRFELALGCPAATVCRSLDNEQTVVLEPDSDGGKSRLLVDTERHGLAAWRLERAGVTVTDTKLNVSEELLCVAESRIGSLGARLSPTIELAGAESGVGTTPGTGDEDEVRQLTKTMASVKLAWEERRYADCQRLLDGYWGQLLLSEPNAPPAKMPVRTRIGKRVPNALRR